MAKSFIQEVEPRAIRSLKFIDDYIASRKPSDDLHRNARMSVSLGNLYVGEHRNKLKDDWQKHQMKRQGARKPKATKAS